MEAAHPTFTLVLALVVGVLAQSTARHLHLPGIVLLLAVGMALGPDGLSWVQPRDLGAGLYAIVELSVAVVLFEGGLNLELSRLLREQAVIRRLITWGALVTLTGAAASVAWLLGWGWPRALLFGSLVVVTGPTVIGPLVRELRLTAKLSSLLEAEGVLIDPIGAIVAVLVLEIVLAPDMGTIAATAIDLAERLTFGTVAGALSGLAMARMLRTRRLVPEGHENILSLALVLLVFQGSEELVPHSGILAVAIAGVVVGNLPTLVDRDLREFKDQLTVLLIGLLFVLLAADVRIEDVQDLGWPGLGVVALLVVAVRPLGVLLSTLGSDLTWRERAFVAWIAPRGIVAAAVASFVAEAAAREGIAGGVELRALVFLTIACTVLLAGLTGGVVSRVLGVRLLRRETVAILGANGLGLELAGLLRAAGRTVVLLDSNPHSCRRAEAEGFSVVFGNALDERVLQRARFESVQTAAGCTANTTLNGVFVDRARDLFGVPEGLVAADRPEHALVNELKARQHADVLFEAEHDVERWDVRDRRGDVEIVRCRYQPPSEEVEPPAEASRELFVILVVERGGTTAPMRESHRPRAGDQAHVAVHRPDRDQALSVLAQLGWSQEASGDEGGEASASLESSAGAPG